MDRSINLSWKKIQYLISLKYSKLSFELCTKEPCDAVSTIISKRVVDLSFYTIYYIDCHSLASAFENIFNLFLLNTQNIKKKLSRMQFTDEKQTRKIETIVLRYNKLSAEDKKIFLLEIIK